MCMTAWIVRKDGQEVEAGNIESLASALDLPPTELVFDASFTRHGVRKILDPTWTVPPEIEFMINMIARARRVFALQGRPLAWGGAEIDHGRREIAGRLR